MTIVAIYVFADMKACPVQLFYFLLIACHEKKKYVRILMKS